MISILLFITGALAGVFLQLYINERKAHKETLDELQVLKNELEYWENSFGEQESQSLEPQHAQSNSVGSASSEGSEDSKSIVSI